MTFYFCLLKISNKCSSREELAFFDHQSIVIRPVNILLNVGQTILIGGIARIDVKHVRLLIMACHLLNIHYF